MTFIKENGNGKMRRAVRPGEVARAYQRALQYHQSYGQERETSGKLTQRKKKLPFHELEWLWSTGLFNYVAMAEISGVSRKSLPKWVGKPVKGRGWQGRRGRIRLMHYAVLIDTLLEMERGHVVDLDVVVRLLVEGGSFGPLAMAVLVGVDEQDPESLKNERLTRRKTVVDPGVLPEPHRPDDAGHPVPGGGERGPDGPRAGDDGPGGGEEGAEGGEPGVVQGPPAGAVAAERPAAEGEGVQPEHRGVAAWEPSPEHKEPDVEEVGWEEYAATARDIGRFGFDEDGDAYLDGRLDPFGGGAVPGLPAPGEEWEQAAPPGA